MEFTRRQALAAIGVSATCLLPTVTQAAKPKTKSPRIVIYIKDIHCNSCAKKIATKLYTVPGIVQVAANVKKNYVVVTPQKSKVPSAKKMWEATISAKTQPVKLVTPQRTYTKLPPK